jgi:hypothetical protein
VMEAAVELHQAHAMHEALSGHPARADASLGRADRARERLRQLRRRRR